MKLQMRSINLTLINNVSVISESIPMFDHLLESSRRDDSNKWSNVGIVSGREILSLEIRDLSGALEQWKKLTTNTDQ